MSQNDSRVDVSPPTEIPSTSGYLTIAQAVQYSGRSLSTIRRALTTGTLPHARVGLGRGQVRIARAALEAVFLAPRPAPGPPLDDPPQRTDRGFTIIELLVVIIIIGILASIATPVFLNQKAKAYDATVKSDLKTASTVAETYAADGNGYPSARAQWDALMTPSAGVALRAFTRAGSDGGYVVYGANVAKAPTRIWALSSWDGGVPVLMTELSDLPDTPPAAGMLSVPAGGGAWAWAATGGTTIGTAAGVPQVMPWLDPALRSTAKSTASTAAVAGIDGLLDSSTGIDTPFKIVPADAPVADAAASFTVASAGNDTGIFWVPSAVGSTPDPRWKLATVGQQWTVSVWVKAPAGTPITWGGRVYNAPTWTWRVTAPAPTAVATGAWQRLSLTFDATAGGIGDGDGFMGVQVRVLRGAAPVGTTVLVTAPQTEIGPRSPFTESP